MDERPVAAIPPRNSQPQAIQNTMGSDPMVKTPCDNLLIQCPRLYDSTARSEDRRNPNLHFNDLPNLLRVRQRPLRCPKDRLPVSPPIQSPHANFAFHCSNLSFRLNLARISLNIETSKSSPARNMFTRSLSFIRPVFTQIAARYSANMTFVSTP